jgi:hypothetical protein
MSSVKEVIGRDRCLVQKSIGGKTESSSNLILARATVNKMCYTKTTDPQAACYEDNSLTFVVLAYFEVYAGIGYT